MRVTAGAGGVVVSGTGGGRQETEAARARSRQEEVAIVVRDAAGTGQCPDCQLTYVGSGGAAPVTVFPVAGETHAHGLGESEPACGTETLIGPVILSSN